MPKQTHDTLADWRRRTGLSQEDAARVLGISQGYYTKLERRLQVPRRTILKRILAKTGVPVAGLYDLRP